MAVEWFRAAASVTTEPGTPEADYRQNALFQLGVLHQAGTGLGGPDWTAAVSFYRSATDLGDVNAMANMGVLLLQGGGGMAANPAEAVQAFKRASAGGCSLESAGCQLAARFLVQCHEQGLIGGGDILAQMKSAAELAVTSSSVDGAAAMQPFSRDAVHVFYRLSDDRCCLQPLLHAHIVALFREIPASARKKRPHYITVNLALIYSPPSTRGPICRCCW